MTNEINDLQKIGMNINEHKSLLENVRDYNSKRFSDEREKIAQNYDYLPTPGCYVDTSNNGNSKSLAPIMAVGGAVAGTIKSINKSLNKGKKFRPMRSAIGGAIIGGGLGALIDVGKNTTKDIIETYPKSSSSISDGIDKTASDIVDRIYDKLVQESENNAYLSDIKCEVCGYEGKPLNDGCCPKCGAFEGKTPSEQSPTEKRQPMIGEDRGQLGVEDQADIDDRAFAIY